MSSVGNPDDELWSVLADAHRVIAYCENCESAIDPTTKHACPAKRRCLSCSSS